MGKPTPPAASPDAVSLQPRPGDGYYDNDAPELPRLGQDDDLPPLYDEAAEASSSASAPLLPNEPPAHPSLPDLGTGSGALQPFRRDETIAYYLDRRLDADADFLEKQVRAWAAVPPRPQVRLHGTHRERRRDRDGRRQTKHVTDFDVVVELTPYLCPDGGVSRANCELRTVEDGEKVRRGGVLRRRAARARDAGRLELGMAERPTLTEWCHMYCASHSGLKMFQLKRQVAGFDEGRVREHLENMVRRTNYRGDVKVTFPVRDEKVEVWNECRTNRWRLTHWILVLFCVTFLWILTLPYLFFRTKKFETVSAVWHYSRFDAAGRKQYVTLSEDQFYNLWGRALWKAVLTKRQGTLDQRDLLTAEGAPPVFNSAVDPVSASVTAMNAVNRQLGWGDHEF